MASFAKKNNKKLTFVGFVTAMASPAPETSAKHAPWVTQITAGFPPARHEFIPKNSDSSKSTASGTVWRSLFARKGARPSLAGPGCRSSGSINFQYTNAHYLAARLVASQAASATCLAFRALVRFSLTTNPSAWSSDRIRAAEIELHCKLSRSSAASSVASRSPVLFP